MSVPIAGLMCHAPIVIPAMGGERASECVLTTRGMQQVAQRIVAARPDVLVVISPHTPRALDEWTLYDGARVRGDFEDFGAPEERIELPGAPEARIKLRREPIPIAMRPEGPIDIGALVPLWFMQKAGWNGPTMVIGHPWEDGSEEAMGIALLSASNGARWAIVASGDMSHRLRQGSPAGFHPRATEFDAEVVAHLKRGDLQGLAELDRALRALAAEDVVAPVTVAAAATGWRGEGLRVFGYEGPFGVGYCTAVLHADAT
jgi:aromatic ring-opening dioxygenase LigB subunit